MKISELKTGWLINQQHLTYILKGDRINQQKPNGQINRVSVINFHYSWDTLFPRLGTKAVQSSRQETSFHFKLGYLASSPIWFERWQSELLPWDSHTVQLRSGCTFRVHFRSKMKCGIFARFCSEMNHYYVEKDFWKFGWPTTSHFNMVLQWMIKVQ